MIIPEGFSFSSVKAEIKYKDRDDLALIYFPRGAKVVALFTNNSFKAAPVLYCQNLLKKNDTFKAILINSGNANACTGETGIKNCELICKDIAKKLHINYNEVLISSTGVIGVQLPVDKFLNKSKELTDNLSLNNCVNVAKAIMTTDSFYKIYSAKNKNFKMLGIAKGAGMINPNMATMLAFILTDAKLEKNFMKESLKRVVDKTFNSITVDGDMSTNDSVFLISTNINDNVDKEEFENSLYETALNLAKMIVKDGEGATKLINISVVNGFSEIQCKKIAETVANSLLVKTAIFGGDPNWGRIVAAIGYSGENIKPDNVNIFIGENKVVANGIESENFSEKKCAEYLKNNEEIKITIDIGTGKESWDYYTCDISYEYVKINSEYRT